MKKATHTRRAFARLVPLALIGVPILGGAALTAARVFEGPQDFFPPVPVPTENPMTEEKRILGKMLFWDEQLSSDNTMACGTCHRPGAGGIDPRHGLNPGPDGIAGTEDDRTGSP
ncbi:hypothetical protein MNBD_PLANCTO03-1369, partial [hydrothermal vent metagenome]